MQDKNNDFLYMESQNEPYITYVHSHSRMIQSNVYGKSSPSWIGCISWKKYIGISKNEYGLYYIIYVYWLNQMSRKLRDQNLGIT